MADSFTEAEAKRLIQLYTEAEADLLREYNKALLKGNDLKALAQLKRNVGIIRQNLLQGGRIWCQEAVPSIYTMAGDETGLKMGAGFHAIHQQAMKVLADNAYQHLVDVDQVIGRRVDDVYRNLALEALRSDVVGFETWKQAAKAYREKLAEKGITGFRDAAGRDWNMKTYTEMVARTTVREVMIEGTSNRLLEHGHDLARISGGSAKNTCDVCRAWVGRIISLTGKTPGYPTMADARAAGVFHPRCTHTISSAMTFEGEIARAKYAADPERKVKAALVEGEHFWKACSERGQASIYQYTNRDINSLINNHIYNKANVDPEVREIITYLDEAMQKASLPEDMTLYRGINADTWNKIKAKKAFTTPGSEIELEGFTSTSYDRLVAWKYASEKSQGAESAVIEILAPKGTRAASIENHSQSPDDKEILINRNTRFKVIEARIEGNVTHLLWEAL